MFLKNFYYNYLNDCYDHNKVEIIEEEDNLDPEYPRTYYHFNLYNGGDCYTWSDYSESGSFDLLEDSDIEVEQLNFTNSRGDKIDILSILDPDELYVE